MPKFGVLTSNKKINDFIDKVEEAEDLIGEQQYQNRYLDVQKLNTAKKYAIGDLLKEFQNVLKKFKNKNEIIKQYANELTDSISQLIPGKTKEELNKIYEDFLMKDESYVETINFVDNYCPKGCFGSIVCFLTKKISENDIKAKDDSFPLTEASLDNNLNMTNFLKYGVQNTEDKKKNDSKEKAPDQNQQNLDYIEEMVKSLFEEFSKLKEEKTFDIYTEEQIEELESIHKSLIDLNKNVLADSVNTQIEKSKNNLPSIKEDFGKLESYYNKYPDSYSKEFKLITAHLVNEMAAGNQIFSLQKGYNLKDNYEMCARFIKEMLTAKHTDRVIEIKPENYTKKIDGLLDLQDYFYLKEAFRGCESADDYKERYEKLFNDISSNNVKLISIEGNCVKTKELNKVMSLMNDALEIIGVPFNQFTDKEFLTKLCYKNIDGVKNSKYLLDKFKYTDLAKKHYSQLSDSDQTLLKTPNESLNANQITYKAFLIKSMNGITPQMVEEDKSLIGNAVATFKRLEDIRSKRGMFFWLFHPNQWSEERSAYNEMKKILNETYKLTDTQINEIANDKKIANDDISMTFLKATNKDDYQKAIDSQSVTSQKKSQIFVKPIFEDKERKNTEKIYNTLSISLGKENAKIIADSIEEDIREQKNKKYTKKEIEKEREKIVEMYFNKLCKEDEEYLAEAKKKQEGKKYAELYFDIKTKEYKKEALKMANDNPDYNPTAYKIKYDANKEEIRKLKEELEEDISKKVLNDIKKDKAKLENVKKDSNEQVINKDDLNKEQVK